MLKIAGVQFIGQAEKEANIQVAIRLVRRSSRCWLVLLLLVSPGYLVTLNQMTADFVALDSHRQRIAKRSAGK